MHHLGLASPNYSSEYSTLLISANILPIPAVIMLIVAGRGFIIWCFNILSIPIVLSYAKRILYGGKQTPDTSTDDRDFPYAARAHSHGNDNILEVSVFQRRFSAASNRFGLSSNGFCFRLFWTLESFPDNRTKSIQ